MSSMSMVGGGTSTSSGSVPFASPPVALPAAPVALVAFALGAFGGLGAGLRFSLLSAALTGSISERTSEAVKTGSSLSGVSSCADVFSSSHPSKPATFSSRPARSVSLIHGLVDSHSPTTFRVASTKSRPCFTAFGRALSSFARNTTLSPVALRASSRLRNSLVGASEPSKSSHSPCSLSSAWNASRCSSVVTSCHSSSS
mmetsp:Transcript_2205/g.7721  ORF Transcript_2205/g.7721 Transcript_2205/m.7721 type:complete len:200 (+) Transcript_2205:368-967(+)